VSVSVSVSVSVTQNGRRLAFSKEMELTSDIYFVVDSSAK
jgi:hypothetical protein